MKTHALLTTILLALIAPLSAEWQIDQPKKEVPKELSGQIWGRKFELGKANWNNAVLTVASKAKMNGWPESQLVFFIGKDDKKTEWLVTPENSNFDSPHIHMKFGKEGADFPGTLMFTGEYSLYLKLVEKKDKKATFQIHVSMPDYKKSYLIGTFEADIQ
ncbi:MAG: hypothetical protein R3242_01115 [Akkermansiaceae bacterium]|nr:hypothetical protein [Akkermansiaceae bacterium]